MILASCGSSESSRTSDYKDVTLDMGDEYSIEEMYSYEYKAADSEYDSVVVTIDEEYSAMKSPEEAQTSEIKISNEVYDSGEFELDGLKGRYVEATIVQDYRTWNGYLPWKGGVLLLSFGAEDSEEGIEKLEECKKLVFNSIKLQDVDKKGISENPEICLQCDDLRKTMLSYTDTTGEKNIHIASIQYSILYEGLNVFNSAKEAWDDAKVSGGKTIDEGEISVKGKQSYWLKNNDGYILFIPDDKHNYISLIIITRDPSEKSETIIEEITKKIQ